MGGKGRKRRQKNYFAAHGGPTRLPPPPDPSKLDALPSKLRRIMSFSSHGSAKPSKLREEKMKQAGGDAVNRFPPKNAMTSEAAAFGDSDDGQLVTSQRTDNDDEMVQHRRDENTKTKKKRKRKQVNDLRFETSIEKTKTSEKRRERKKRYLEAKKKKHQKSKTEENLEFPGREQIKFGDVVQAPPKLVALPKVLKNVPNVSQERIRLQAIEAYRKHKGWTSRPGLKLPSVATTPSV